MLLTDKESHLNGRRRGPLVGVLRSPQFCALLVCLILGLILEYAVRSKLIPVGIVASPSEVIIDLLNIQQKVDFWQACQITILEILVAVALELIVAIPFGYFLAKKRAFGLAYTGWLNAMFAAPIFLLYPLFLVLLGRSYATLIIMGFLPGVIPLILQVQQGFLSVKKTWINVGRGFDLTEHQLLWKIMIPAAAPTIFTGFRLALMYTSVNIVAIEYLTDFGGLGRIVADRYFRFDIPGTYAAIIAVTGISIVLNGGIGYAERMVRKR